MTKAWDATSSTKFYVSGVSNLAAGRMAFATPDITATSSRPARGPPPSSARTAASGVPIANSPTPARAVLPLTVHTIVPGDSAVPTLRNQSGPFTMIAGTFANVSTLLASVGGATVPAVGPASSTCAAEELAESMSAAWSAVF